LPKQELFVALIPHLDVVNECKIIIKFEYIMKKLCFLTAGILPVPVTEGGAVESLVQIMLENNEVLKKQPFELHVISKYTPEAVEKANQFSNVHFHFINYSRRRYKIYMYLRHVLLNRFHYNLYVGLFPFLSKARKIVKQENFDIVVIENRPEFAPYLRNCISSKIVSHLHNDLINNEMRNGEKLAKSSDLILTVSDYIRKRTLTTNINVDKVVTVRNVVDTNRFTQLKYNRETKALRKSLGFKDNDIVIVFSGRLDALKGIDKLISALEVCQHRVKLLVIGASFYGGETSSDTLFVRKLRESAEKIKDRIVFTGFVDYEKMPQYYNVADIAVLPSQWDDPAPLTVFETQACGIPLITTDSGGITEYISPDVIVVKRGERFEERLADAINELVSDPERRKKMSASEVHHIKQFDSSTYYDVFCKSLTNLGLI